MSTMKREYAENYATENQEPSNEAPVLIKRSKSSIERATGPTPIERFSDFVAAWSAGKFNIPEEVDATVDAFFTQDVVYDVVGTGNGHTGVEVFKTYSFDTIRDWFAVLGDFDIVDLDLTQAPGASPNEVWQMCRWTKSTSKTTGKSATDGSLLCISTWEGTKCSKFTLVYDDPAIVAAVLNKDAAVAVPPGILLPSFEPHQEPKRLFDAVFAAWGAGEYAHPETGKEAIAKHFAPNAVIDATSSVLPATLKAYSGIDGCDAWIRVLGDWGLSNLDVAIIDGLKPGCVLQKLSCDLKHVRTGIEAKGVVIYVEHAYNAEGKGVYIKHYFTDPLAIAAIYEGDDELAEYSEC